jgi:hypothetical protein
VRAFFYRLPEQQPAALGLLGHSEPKKPMYVGSYEMEWKPAIGDYFEFSGNLLLVRQVWFRFDPQGNSSVVVALSSEAYNNPL